MDEIIDHEKRNNMSICTLCQNINNKNVIPKCDFEMWFFLFMLKLKDGKSFYVRTQTSFTLFFSVVMRS